MATTWIILVNWNGGADTVECLESLLRLDTADFKVAVVDNGSSDDSRERIAAWARAPAPDPPSSPVWDRLPRERRRQPSFAQVDGKRPPIGPTADVILIAAGANLGFAAANNLGMRFAANDPEARYYWLLNNDTVVAPDSLSLQIERMEDDARIGMLGARLMFYREPALVQGLAGGFHRLRARGYHFGLGLAPEALPPGEQVERDMAYVLGASMFVRRAMVEQVGGMSEAYFLYFEELDWARRLPATMRLAIAPDAVVWHKEGGSIGSATRSRSSDTSLYYLAAGLLRFCGRHDRALLPVAVARTLRDAIGFAVRGDHAAARAVLTAGLDVLRRIPRRGRFGSAEFAAANRGVNLSGNDRADAVQPPIPATRP